MSSPETSAVSAASEPREELADLERLARRVDEALTAVEALPDDSKDVALELKQAIESFHKVGLTTIIRTLREDPRGKELLFGLVDDPGIYALFAMHGLVRADLATRVAQVLDASRPYLQSHGGDVELVAIEGSTVKVRMAGACNGCSMSAVTLRQSIEEALVERIAEIDTVEEIKDEVQPSIVPLSALGRSKRGWKEGPALEAVESGQPFRLDIDETSIVLIRIGDQVQAFRNACAHQGLPIDGGRVDCDDATLTCPWHGFRFDALTGECFTSPQAQLEMFPLRIQDGKIWVRPS